MKKALSLLLALLMIFSFGLGYVEAANATVGGKEFSTINEAGVTLFDLESAKGLGFKISTEKNSFIAEKSGIKFDFTKGSNLAKVNGVEFKLLGKAVEKDGKAFVPLRFFFETANYEVDRKDGKTVITEKEAPAYPVVFKDNKNTYTIEKEPEKIISMAPDITETIFRLGAGEKIVGRTKFCNYPKDTEKIVAIGSMFEPDLEKIVSLKPDLVMAATHFKEEHLKKLEEGKISTFAKATPNSIEECYSNILTIGNIVNKNAEARALVSTMREKVNYSKMLTKNLEKPSVYYVVGIGDSGEYTYGGDTFFNDLILASGSKNAAGDVKGFKFSIEQLIKANPEYLFGQEYVKDVLAGENYKKLTGKLTVVEADPFSRPTERAVTVALPILIKTVHPELAKKIDF